jgi:hypothetical protein
MASASAFLARKGSRIGLAASDHNPTTVGEHAWLCRLRPDHLAAQQAVASKPLLTGAKQQSVERSRRTRRRLGYPSDDIEAEGAVELLDRLVKIRELILGYTACRDGA